MNSNYPILPQSEHRPASVDVLLGQLADITARLKKAERAVDAAAADMERGEQIDADALVEALAADKPEPESTLPALRERHERATNLVNALSRLRGDYRAKLNDTVNAEARGGWYAAESEDAEAAEAAALALIGEAVVKIEDALAKRSRAAWLARAASGQVRDYAGPSRLGTNLTQTVEHLLGIPARKQAARDRVARQEQRDRVAAEEAEADAIREARAARRAEQDANEARGRTRYLEALARQAGSFDAA